MIDTLKKFAFIEKLSKKSHGAFPLTISVKNLKILFLGTWWN
jgi:hypothetical protein